MFVVLMLMPFDCSVFIAVSLREKGFILAKSSRLQAIMVETSMYQEHEATDQIISTVRSYQWGHVC